MSINGISDEKDQPIEQQPTFNLLFQAQTLPRVTLSVPGNSPSQNLRRVDTTLTRHGKAARLAAQ